MPLVEKNLADIVTLSRASARMNTNSAGTLTAIASGAFGIDYDPATLTVRGMPVEEQRTNLLTYNQQFDNAAWVKTTMTVTPNVGTAPDGTNTATTLTATGAGSVIQQAPTISSGAAYAGAIWIKRRTGTGQVSLRVAELTLMPITVTSSWQRLQATNTSASTTGRFAVHLATSGDEVDIWGAQLEAGSFASSYMGETTTAAITRLADSLTIGTLSPWFNAVSGTMYVETELVGLRSASSQITAFSDGTSSNRFGQFVTTGNLLQTVVTAGGVSQIGSLSQPAVTAGTVYRYGLSYAANNVGAGLNGVDLGNDASVVLPTGLNVLAFSSNGSSQQSLWLRKFIYYPAIKNTQTLTA